MIIELEEIPNIKDAELCFECITHFDFTKRGYKLKMTQGFPRTHLLNITFCSKDCYELGMNAINLHTLLKNYNIRLKLKTWLAHPIKCNCEICISENNS